MDPYPKLTIARLAGICQIKHASSSEQINPEMAAT
jgi:hypothetical protein